MKTPQSAAKRKGSLSTPTSGKISKNKSTPMNLKTKVLEKNAKLALLKAQDTITMNGKSPKPKKMQNGGSPKNSPKQNVVGKKRNSVEGTPAGNAGVKKAKKAEVSPEVKLGLKIEKLLESPKDAKPAEGKMSKNQKKKAKKLALATSPKAVESPKADSPGKKKKKNRKGKKPSGSSPPTPTTAVETPPSSPPGGGKKSKKQKTEVPQVEAQDKPEVASPKAGKKSKRKKRKEAKKKAAAAQSPVSPKQVKKDELKKKMDAKVLAKKDKQTQKKEQPAKNGKIEKPRKKGEKGPAKGLNNSKDNLLKDINTGAGAVGDFPNVVHAENALKALIEDENDRKGDKPSLLDDSSQILMVVEFFYHPPVRSIQRIVLPNAHMTNNVDVLFIATDMKKNRTDPEESIEHHTNLFKSSGVTSITEIMPWRQVRKEHSQYEEKRKLVNRADVILIDSKLSHRVSSIIPRKAMHKKVPIPVRMGQKGSALQKEVATALRKTPIVMKQNSLTSAIKIGHVGMRVKSLVENMSAVAAALTNEKMFPGGKPNIRNIHIKTSKSEAFPVYISIAKRSQIPQPRGALKKKRETVEGEVTTAGVTVAVRPDGKIKIISKDVSDSDDETEHDTSPKKKRKVAEDEEVSDDDSEGDSGEELDPADVETFLKDNRADSDGEDDDDDDDSENEIDRAEQEFLLELRQQQDALEAAAGKLQKGKQVGKKDQKAEEEDSDDEEYSDDEEDTDLEGEVDSDGLDEESDEEEDGESDDSEVPDLVPVKAAPPKKGKKGGKPGLNGLGKGKPSPVQNGKVKGKPAAGPKNKPKAQKGGAVQKTKNSPKGKRR